MLLGTSFIPNNGNHTQKIPPITSVNDNNVNSAEAGSIEHTSTSAVAFLSSSDHSLKENVFQIAKKISSKSSIGSMKLISSFLISALFHSL